MNTVSRSLLQLITRRARLVIVKGDITRENVDAIVNAAKPSLLGGGGVDGAIHQAAGPGLLAECRQLRAAYPDGLHTGGAAPTTAHRLMADFVIHTVGPDMRIGQDDPALLRSCYTESLKVADKLKARTVAFPLISSGVYGWDTNHALLIAITALTETRTRVKTARLVLFDDATVRDAKRIMIELGKR